MTRLLLRTGKWLLVVAALLLIAVFVSIPWARIEMPQDLLPADNRQPIAIDNVNVVTVTSAGVLRDRQVLIEDGRIVDILPAGSTPNDRYLRIDGNGSYLSPGLFDMHVHAMDRKYLAMSLAYGVTSVRNMGGYPMHLRWKRELADGEWLGANLFTATPTMNGRKNANPFGHKVVTDPEKARRLVRKYHSQGWDFVKAYTRLDVPVFEAIIDEADKLDFPVAGHVPYPVVDADYRLATPMVTLEHAEDVFQGPLDYEYDEAALDEIAATLRSMDATVTPTLMIFDHLTRLAREKRRFFDDFPMEFVNPMMKRFVDGTAGARWLGASDQLVASLERRNEFFGVITRVLHEHGVDLVLGTDWGAIYALPGVSTHDEIDLLLAAGIPPDAVLPMATVNAAAVLRVEGELGSISTGMVADLVVTKGNPLDDPATLRQPEAVVKNGQWLDRDALDALLESARSPSGTFATFGRVLEFVFH